MKRIIFDLICLIHVIIWIFIIFAFIDIRAANINLFYIIPLIYLLHILPFHIIIEQKKKLYKNSYKNKENEFFKKTSLIHIINLIEYLDKKCFLSPLSAQGMMIFGALSSSYVLLNKYPFFLNYISDKRLTNFL
jgi:hypothetical protein